MAIIISIIIEIFLVEQRISCWFFFFWGKFKLIEKRNIWKLIYEQEKVNYFDLRSIRLQGFR